jgi:hypothetical protein
MGRELSEPEVRQIEKEIDAAFLDGLGIAGIWKSVLRDAALEATEEVLAGHGTAKGEARQGLISFSHNVVNGCNVLLRHIELIGVDERTEIPDDLDRRVHRALVASSMYTAIEDAYVSYTHGYAKADLPADRVIRMSPPGTALDARLRYFSGNSPDVKLLGNQGLEPLDLPNLSTGTYGERFAQAMATSSFEQQGGFSYTLEQSLVNDFAGAYHRFFVSAVDMSSDTQLGTITLDVLLRGYAVVCTVAYLHKMVSVLTTPEGWEKSINWPSCFRPRKTWIELFEGFCGAPHAEPVVELLSFIPERFDADITVTPLVRFDQDYIGISPSAVLLSNIPRNVLVLLTKMFSREYSTYTSGKEALLVANAREVLKDEIIAQNVKLPNWKGAGLPDIDLIFRGADDQLIVACEIKWQLSASSTREVVYRDEYLKKGIKQLLKIREFLLHHRDFLRKRGIVDVDMAVGGATFLLLCKGHLASESVFHDGILICDYDWFVRTVQERGIEAALDGATSFSYLPKEGVDFVLQPLTIRFGKWRLSWLSMVPPVLPEDDEKSVVLDFYDESLEFLL